jgi:hypothetical protein
LEKLEDRDAQVGIVGRFECCNMREEGGTRSIDIYSEVTRGERKTRFTVKVKKENFATVSAKRVAVLQNIITTRIVNITRLTRTNTTSDALSLLQVSNIRGSESLEYSKQHILFTDRLSPDRVGMPILLCHQDKHEIP